MILSTAFPKVISVKLEQLVNVLELILVTESPTTNVSRFVQPANAFAPIDATDGPVTTCVKSVRFAKAPASIIVTGVIGSEIERFLTPFSLENNCDMLFDPI